ncbi:hypothetical protein [Burkholderia latens]|uniref:Uncharacterized protein n=1 Tax=Burkholderia latens TaxID=488446 RepID=A0A6H9SR75_9BURK|nr:hypothetical protein [Burkholderia latens]KAB0631499.1 hypothetical protein F7R21_31535 [Burkholderia latens]VWB09799.1 hypothetical protein BLA24064_00272 [Burkholderia latens]
MIDTGPSSTFRHLPLTREQDAEIRHYIKRKKQRGEPWNTAELATMLADMLDPPPNDDDEPVADVDGARLACEHALASVDDAMEYLAASEERLAAMEAEAMKRPQR